MSVWVRKIKLSLRKLRRSRESCQEVAADIPHDWHNTLVRKCPSLQRSSSSASSFTSSGSSGSSSSSYSVNDFLRDLAASEELSYTKDNSNIKTSTPFTCAIIPLNRLGLTRNSEIRDQDNQDMTGMKIYDDDGDVEQVPRKSSLKKQLRYNYDQNLYENGQFLREIEDMYNEEDVDDGYEIIFVNNNLGN